MHDFSILGVEGRLPNALSKNQTQFEGTVDVRQAEAR
jgi:hypothetical protein